jgi:arsenical pump membrane protein
VPEWLALAVAIVALVATLAVAIARPPWLPEAVAATVAAGLLVTIGAVSVERALQTAEELAPTIGFLAALLLLADGSRREGLFDALGALMARSANNSPRRLLALVFVTASLVTVALGLDPTIVLLTPVVFMTATRLRMNPKPHVYASAHLANSASLMLPISNLTNLLAFRTSGLTLTHFAALMALPTLAAIAVEWVVFSRFFAVELGRPCPAAPTVEAPHLPRQALAVLGATLFGFLVGPPLAVDPLLVATAGALAITVPALVRRTATPRSVLRALEPTFLVFVLGLGIVVAAVSDNGVSSAVRSLLPDGSSLPDLLLIAVVGAVLANLANNLPAILILAPATATIGPAAVLAALVGVNIGPNLTYVGSLATLLWRRVLRAEDTEVSLLEFVRLGALTVPAAVFASTLSLWAAAQVGL